MNNLSSTLFISQYQTNVQLSRFSVCFEMLIYPVICCKCSNVNRVKKKINYSTTFPNNFFHKQKPQ